MMLKFSVSMQLANVMTFDPVTMTYDPTVWLNDFWILREYLIPMNKTVTELPLIFSLYTLSNWKFQIYLQMDTAFDMQVRSPPCVLAPSWYHTCILTDVSAISSSVLCLWEMVLLICTHPARGGSGVLSTFFDAQITLSTLQNKTSGRLIVLLRC
jgi:hypothetical protein